MRTAAKFIACLAALLLLAGCAPAAESGPLPSAPAAPVTAVPSAAPTAAPTTAPTAAPTADPQALLRQKAEALLANMTMEEKIGQLFIVFPESLDVDPANVPEAGVEGYGLTAVSPRMVGVMADYPVGGVVLFEGNIVSPEQLTSLVGDLQAASEVPLFIAVDEEGGRITRLAKMDNFALPRVGSMESLGKTGRASYARTAGLTVGGYLTRYGINLNFAPVADVNTNPNNIVIGDRAFGSDPHLVAQMAGGYLEGLHQSGVMGTLKHFPGHGDTDSDTHTGYVAIRKDWEQLKACELIPFTANLSQADMVMTAHITADAVTGDGLPASLSHEMITGKLRGELGYGGVVITDALNMGAITKQYTCGESAVMAIEAGADILLAPKNYIAACEGVRLAVAQGRITPARIDESVLRILMLKLEYGLLP